MMMIAQIGNPILASCLMFLIVAVAVTHGGPFHASCSINWSFGIPCSEVSKKLQSQIKLWRSDTKCNGGQKCLYKLVSVTESSLSATHTTPVKHYVDDLTFTFTENTDSALKFVKYEEAASEVCSVHGYSTSETWYAVYDMGTNYCNLHSLITGSGLNKVSGYHEETSDSTCTQYSSANCDKY